jgi:hypothetical protein
MPQYTPDQLRSELVNPMTVLVSQFSEGVSQMEALMRSGKIPAGGLPLTGVMAIKALATIRKLRRDLFDKLEAAQDGSLEDLERKRVDMANRRKSGKPKDKPHGKNKT